ncbi:MAG: NUDIX domain-containing protein [Roseobacter sp.]
MKPLFLFGTLRFLPLLETVLGTLDHLSMTHAELPGFLVRSVDEGPFPMIVSAPDGKTTGLLVQGLRQTDFDRLDFYEGAFGYIAQQVMLADGQEALVYFPQPDLWTPHGEWSFEEWRDQYGALSIHAAREAMSYHGVKPPAEVGAMFPMIRSRAWSRMNAMNSKHGALTLSGTVEITEQRRPYANYFTLEEYDLRHDRFDGSLSPEVSRAVFISSDAALVLPYDPHRDRVLLVEQVRLGPVARGDRAVWQLEPIAGRVDAGESAEQAARREAFEEAGLELEALEPVAEAYCSPGSSSEFYYIYVGLADLADEVAGLGGLEAEDEDIRSHLVSFDALMEMCANLEISNAPLILACYWLAHHRDRLRNGADDTL